MNLFLIGTITGDRIHLMTDQHHIRRKTQSINRYYNFT